jgi:hypothetical protein
MSGVYPPMPVNGLIYWERTSGGRSGIVSNWTMVIEEFAKKTIMGRERGSCHASLPLSGRLPARHLNFAVSWPWKPKCCHQTSARFRGRSHGHPEKDHSSRCRDNVPPPNSCCVIYQHGMVLLLRFTPPIRRWQVGDQPESPMGFR